MTEKKLKARNAKRDLGAELLASVLEINAGKRGRIHKVALSDVTQARARSGLSQSQFAQVLGVSPRTLEEWEHGRRKPSGAAQSLLAIAARWPDVSSVKSSTRSSASSNERFKQPFLPPVISRAGKCVCGKNVAYRRF